MCSGKNGLGGNPVTSIASGEWFLWVGTGDSDRVVPIIQLGLMGHWMKGSGGRSRWVRSVSDTVWLVL